MKWSKYRQIYSLDELQLDQFDPILNETKSFVYHKSICGEEGCVGKRDVSTLMHLFDLRTEETN